MELDKAIAWAVTNMVATFTYENYLKADEASHAAEAMSALSNEPWTVKFTDEKYVGPRYWVVKA